MINQQILNKKIMMIIFAMIYRTKEQMETDPKSISLTKGYGEELKG